MRRHVALGAEVLARGDEARAEELLPVAVHGDPRHQRIRLVHQPVGEAQPVAGEILRHRRQRRGRSGEDALARLVVVAAVEHVGGRLASRHLLHDMGDRTAASQFPPLGVDFESAIGEAAVLLVLRVDVAQKESLPLVLGQLRRPLARGGADGAPLRQDPRLFDREDAVEDTHVGDPAAGEVLGAALRPPIVAAEVEGPVVADAALDLREELAALLGDPVAVAVDVQPAALAGAVVGEDDVRPLAGSQPLRVVRIDRDAGRASARPRAVAPEAEVQLAGAERDLPAAVCLVRVALAGDGVAALGLGHVDPHGERERRVGVELKRRKLGRGLVAEEQGR